MIDNNVESKGACTPRAKNSRITASRKDSFLQYKSRTNNFDDDGNEEIKVANGWSIEKRPLSIFAYMSVILKRR